MVADDTRMSLVPPGAPRWVTDELIAHTLRVWQPRYKKELTPQDALEILMNVTELFKVLHSYSANESSKPAEEAERAASRSSRRSANTSTTRGPNRPATA